MIKVVSRYEDVSGQMVNKGKSFFYAHEKSPLVLTIRLRNITRLGVGNFPLIYLGCTIFLGRRKVCYYEAILSKIDKKMRG